MGAPSQGRGGMMAVFVEAAWIDLALMIAAGPYYLIKTWLLIREDEGK